MPFYEPGRAELIKELRGWLDGNGRVRARLIHGDGGMGKTRLFIELCERLNREGNRLRDEDRRADDLKEVQVARS